MGQANYLSNEIINRKPHYNKTYLECVMIPVRCFDTGIFLGRNNWFLTIMLARNETKKTTVDSWFRRNYGSRRGFVRTYYHRMLYLLGKYRYYREIEWDKVERLVFICKGNICRSAYAEAHAKMLELNAISCGLDTIVDAPANRDAMQAATRRGLSLEQHKTKPIMYHFLQKTDLLIVMEPWQAEYLQNTLIRKHQCTLLGLWGRPAKPHIQDPYGSTANYFDICFEYIEDCIHEIADRIKK